MATNAEQDASWSSCKSLVIRLTFAAVVVGAWNVDRSVIRSFVITSTSTSTSGRPTRLPAVKDGSSPSSTYHRKYQPQLWRHQIGSWQGNLWIPPPGWRYFSTPELQEIYANRTLLWLVDSTGRRAAMDLFVLLNATLGTSSNNNSVGVGPGAAATMMAREVSVKALDDPRVIDVNKLEPSVPCHKWPAKNVTPTQQTAVPLYCQPMPNHPEHDFVLVRKDCTKDVQEFLTLEIQGGPNIVLDGDDHTRDGTSTSTPRRKKIMVISMGVWETRRQQQCSVHGRPLTAIVNDTIQILDQIQRRQPDTIIIWRTSGWVAAETFDEENERIARMNQFIMDQIDALAQSYATPTAAGGNSSSIITSRRSNLTYVDWGSAIQARSFLPERIRGDLPPHYGLEPRLVLTHMITNRLQEFL